MTKPLSPAAQAILDSFKEQVELTWLTKDPDRVGLAAALRAVVDLVVPEEELYGGDQRWVYERDARQNCRDELLAIAKELEN